MQLYSWVCKRETERERERERDYLLTCPMSCKLKLRACAQGTRPLIGVPCTVAVCHSVMSCGGANLLIVIEF